MMNSLSKNNQMLLIYASLTIATLAAFWQVNACEFIFFDDPDYVTENNHVQSGLTLEGIRWALTSGEVSNWHPVTWISHMLDVQFFGLQPRWHHVTNLLFHLANTLLLFFILHRMTKARWESAFVAALFALHPLHVESVAWVAERKDVLSTFFWILTMAAYCLYVERPGMRRYLFVVLFFALGLMSKPMLVTLPFVLLLLDYWPLQRFQQIPLDQKINTAVNKPVSGDKQKGKTKKKQAAGEEAKAAVPARSLSQWTLIRPLLWEKLPLLVLTILSSIVTYSVQQKGGMVKSFESFPLSDRISNTFISYITYIGQAIWPDGLAVLYSYPLLFTTWQVFGAVFLLMAITTAVLWKAKRIPYATVGWLWYMSTLVPVIGIVQVGLQARADRYTYVPLIGLFIMAAWGIPELSKKWRYRKEALFASSTVVLFCLCIVTWTQVRFWQDNITLLDHAVKVTDNNYLAYYSRGLAWWRLGNTGQAIGDYDKALSIHPKYDIAYNNRGSVYAVLGNYRQAIRDFDKALEISPNNAGLYINRGNAHSLLGNDRQAIGDYDKVIEINPKDVDAYSRRGAAYANLGNYQQAIRDYGQALSINPKYAEAYYNRGNSNVRLGNYREAIGDYDKAIAINVKYAATYNNRAFAYLRLGNTGQAVEDLKTAARLGYKDAQNTLKGRGMGW